MDWLLGPSKRELYGQFADINDVEELQQICYKLHTNFEMQKEQTKSLQTLISELSDREESLKVKNQSLLIQLNEAKKLLESKTHECADWKKRAMSMAFSSPEKPAPSTETASPAKTKKKRDNLKKPPLPPFPPILSPDHENKVYSDNNQTNPQDTKTTTHIHPNPVKDHHDTGEPAQIVSNSPSENILSPSLLVTDSNGTENYNNLDSQNKSKVKEAQIAPVPLYERENNELREQVALLTKRIEQLKEEKWNLECEKNIRIQTMELETRDTKELKAQAETAQKEVNSLTEIHHKILMEHAKLQEERERMTDQITDLSDIIVLITSENYNLAKMRGKAVPLPPELKLPDTEYTIAWWGATSRKVGGYIYITPHYFCFVPSWTGRTIIRVGVIIIELVNIICLDKVSMGFFSKHTVRLSTLEVKTKDNQVYTFSALMDRKGLVRTAIQQSAILHHAIEVKRDSEEDDDY